MVTPADDLITNFGAADPSTEEEWDDWVSPSRLRNYAMGTPINDWLDRVDDSRRIDPSDRPLNLNWTGPASRLPRYDRSLDFMKDMSDRGIRFESLVWNFLRSSRLSCVRICIDPRTEARDLDKAKETLEEMRNGTEIIYQGALRDHRNRIVGSPDFLVRADVLPRLVELSGSLQFSGVFGGNLNELAPELSDDEGDEGVGWHYRVVDVKFKTWNPVNGNLYSSGKPKGDRIQLAAYNLGLETMQGYAPPEAYILGRGWKTTSGGGSSGINCFERLGIVDFAGKDIGVLQDASDAADWIREMRTSGFSRLGIIQRGLPPITLNWTANTPMPTHANLRVDDAKDHWPWDKTVAKIARAQNEISLLPGIRAVQRTTLLAGPPALTDGWRDTNFSLPPIANATKALILQQVFDANRLATPGVLPSRATGVVDPRFRNRHELEFFVDYEWVQSPSLEDFSTFPNASQGAELIYMIGCGHSVNGSWSTSSGFQCFVVADLTQPEEERIFREWFDHMATVRASVLGSTSGSPEPPIIHWEDPERSRNKSARSRAGDPTWWPPSSPTQIQIRKGATVPPGALPFWDISLRLMKEEPFAVTDAFGGGLKEISEAIEPLSSGSVNLWPPSPIEHGLAALMAPIASWRASITLNTRLPSPNQDQFADRMIEYSRVYNKVDCKIMFEILKYLRANH